MKINRRQAFVAACVVMPVIIFLSLVLKLHRKDIDFNQAMPFDGQAVEIRPQPVHRLSVFTVEAWVWPAEIRPGRQTLVAKDDAGQRRNFGLALAPNALKLQITRCGDEVYDSQGELHPDAWTHIALTFDSTALTLYLDGQPDSTFIPGAPACATDASLWIGGYGSDSAAASYFAGKITEVRLWNLARTPDEIQSAMNIRLTGKEPGLVGYWPLDDSAADEANDLTGYQDGVIHH